MNTKKLSVLLAAMIAFAPAANAANTWKMNLPVSSIITINNGAFILILTASDPACGPSGNQFYVQAGLNGQTPEGVKVALSVALMAFATGKTINVLQDNTISGCPVQLVQLNPQ